MKKKYSLFILLLCAATILVSIKAQDKETLVRFMRAIPVTVQRAAVGHGPVVPNQEWTGFSEAKGKIISIGFSLLRMEDLKNPKGFFTHLKNASDPLSQYIRHHFYPQEWQAIEASYDSPTPQSAEFMDVLLMGLNRAIQDKRLYEYLPGKNRPLFKEKMLKQETMRLNRLALQEVYSEYLVPYNFSFAIEEGCFIPQGMAICQIDPTEYNLLIKQKEIVIQRYQIQFKELQKELSQIRETLVLEQKRLQLLELEYQRKEKLLKSSAISIAEVERALNEFLRQQNVFREIDTKRELLPLKIQNLQASEELARAELELARLERNKTVLLAPFDLRITSKNLEINQFVTVGQKLIEGHALDKNDVLGQFKLGDVRFLMAGAGIRFNLSEYLVTGGNIFTDKAKLKAIVTVPVQTEVDKYELTWEGEITRILAGIDFTTQTATLVATVKDPYQNVEIGVRPALMKGMQCKVTILGGKVPNCFCIPRSAYQQGRILILNNGKLEFRSVKLDFYQEHFVMIREGIRAEEKIILDDIPSAKAQMPLHGVDKTEEIIASYPWFVEK